jgi:hypothetical protein
VRRESAERRTRTDLARFFPYFGMLSTEDFRVKKTVSLPWCCSRIGLTTDLYMLTLREVNMFGDERVIERV